MIRRTATAHAAVPARAADLAIGSGVFAMSVDPHFYNGIADHALATLDPSAREKMLVQATEMLTDDIGFIPLYQLVNSWASRKGVIYEPRTDQRSVAMRARPE